MSQKSFAIKVTQDQITQRLKALLTVDNYKDAFLIRKVFPQYQKAQDLRFSTQNNHPDLEGEAWAQLSPKYAKRKPRKYRDFPFAGSKLMIGKAHLFQGVLGKTPYGRVLARGGTLTVSTGVEYAKYHDEGWSPLPQRKLTGFSKRFTTRIKSKWTKYVASIGGRRGTPTD